MDFIGDDVGTSTGILTLQGDSGDKDFLVRLVIQHPMCMVGVHRPPLQVCCLSIGIGW